MSYCFCCCWALVIASPEGNLFCRLELYGGMLTVFLSNVSSMFFCTCARLFLWPNLWFYEKAADVEIAREHQGSVKVRVEAFMTLRILVAKVN